MVADDGRAAELRRLDLTVSDADLERPKGVKLWQRVAAVSVVDLHKMHECPCIEP